MCVCVYIQEDASLVPIPNTKWVNILDHSH